MVRHMKRRTTESKTRLARDQKLSYDSSSLGWLLSALDTLSQLIKNKKIKKANKGNSKTTVSVSIY